MSNITFRRITPHESRIYQYGDCVGDVYRQDDILNPGCLLYTSPSPRDGLLSRMPSSA